MSQELGPDGTVLDNPGFDLQTGILFDARGANFPAIPAAPTKAEASAALGELKLLICEFPFVAFSASAFRQKRSSTSQLTSKRAAPMTKGATFIRNFVKRC
jgi:hypothetical protein